MLTHVAPAAPPRAPDAPECAPWPVVNDPAQWRRFVLKIIDQHHQVRIPGAGADQCSCGRPFMLCPVGPLAQQLLD